MPKKVLDQVALARAAYDGFYRMKSTIELARKYQEDPDREVRLDQCLCQVHFYAGRGIGGAAMTSRACSVCDQVVWSGSTNADLVCKECARQHGLCRYCGADMHLRRRRRKYMFLNDNVPELSPTSIETDPGVMLLPTRSHESI